jgi:hypothetical protein
MSYELIMKLEFYQIKPKSLQNCTTKVSNSFSEPAAVPDNSPKSLKSKTFNFVKKNNFIIKKSFDVMFDFKLEHAVTIVATLA